MKSIIFVTHNQNKLKEVKAILDGKYHIISSADINCTEEIPETSNTIEGNALQKARYVKENYGYDCFADDTGLEVDALGGEPGVDAAIYAGVGCSYEDNVRKLLETLGDNPNRTARFRTVIALILEGREYLFEGIVNGRIIWEGKGTGGFGYDPIFVPDGYTETFSEMALELKNSISHRGRAVSKLAEFLNQYKSTESNNG